MAKTKRGRGAVRTTNLAVVHPHAAGLDVGARFHVAAVAPERAEEPVKSFGSFTDDLHALVSWLQGAGVTSVAMESTGVYWIPVYEILEAKGFEVFLANARGRKGGAWAEERRERRAVAPAAASVRTAAPELPAEPGDCRPAGVPAPSRAAARLCGRAHPAYSESAHADEPPTSPRRDRHHRCNGHTHHS
ncbi:MAG: transposase [Nitrococcus mobilis]|nr:transposase [Nitrococcus mobilis]